MRAVRRGEMLRAVNGLRVRRVVLAALLCAAAFPPLALGATSLVFPASELHALGFRPVGASAATAGRTLGLGLPRGTAVQASAGRARGKSLSFDAFAIPSPGGARRLLARWKREHHAQSVPVGAGGAVWFRAHAAEVVWREGSRLGLVVLKGSRSTRDSAISYAFSADQFLGVMLPATAWQNVLDQVRSNGTMSEQTALQAVALAYGPVPGVKPPQGTRTAIASGTLASQWALHYSGRLSGRRRAVIDRLLGVEPVRSAAAVQAPDWGDPSFRELKALDDLANHWATIEGAHLGIAPRLKIVAGTSSDNIDAYADSLPLNQDRQWGSGQPVYCRIRLDRAGQKAEPQFVGLAEQVPFDSEVAAMPDPGVTGAYVVVASALGTKPAGCSGPGTAYGADVGTPSELQLTSAWPSQDLRTLDCGAYLAQLAGGDSIGLLYALSANGGVYYRRFDPATDVFEVPTQVSNKSTSLAGVLAVAQDSAGNVYAAWGNTLANHVMISYSTSGGARWSAPVSIGLTVDTQAIAGAGGGEFEIAYLNHGNEYLVPVSYQAFG